MNSNYKKLIMVKKISMNVFTLLFAMTFALAAQAQFQQEAPQQEPIEVSDGELDTFVEGLVKAQEVQNDSQMKMIELVEDDGLGVEKFNEIHEAMTIAMQSGEEEPEVEASSEEMESYHELSSRIEEISMEADEEITSAIEDEGMEMPRFQEILAAVQTDPELQQQIQQKMQPQGQQPQPPSGN
ncbi:MAG: DUF4168 domain-containing protein [Balneolales bacterium]